MRQGVSRGPLGVASGCAHPGPTPGTAAAGPDRDRGGGHPGSGPGARGGRGELGHSPPEPPRGLVRAAGQGPAPGRGGAVGGQ